MRVFCIVFLITGLWHIIDARMSIRGLSNGLSGMGSTFIRGTKNHFSGIEGAASLAGYNFAALGTYWRSNTLVGFSQMKKGEIEEAMETFNLAVSTLAVWDLGQGIAYPIAQKLIDNVILKHQDEFADTMRAFSSYNQMLETNALDPATKVANADILKQKMIDGKRQISIAFQDDVERGMSKFVRNTQLYGDLVTDLKGVKAWAKAARWADIFAGPLFDAATVAVSAWQLHEAIKAGDSWAIASSSLGLASGLAGLTGFAVAALATAGTTLAAVAGPIGAIIGAILGIASIVVEIIASLNPYNQINQDIEMLQELTTTSKQMLIADLTNLEKIVPSNSNLTFSWVYEANQGLMIEYVRGRASDYYVPVKFRLEEPVKEEDGYMVIGKLQQFDRSKYPDNLFWNPEGVVDIGYDFYGKKITESRNGVTVIAGTNLVSGHSMDLKGLDIITYENEADNHADSVVIDDMYDIAEQNNIKVRTGGGNDVIVMNGLIGKPGNEDYDFNRMGYGMKVRIYTAADSSRESKRRESNVFSMEGMSTMPGREYGITGIKYDLVSGSLNYLVEESGTERLWFVGHVEGIKMFVGSPFKDVVTFDMDHDYAIRETKGSNEYILRTTSWERFAITIDDQSEVPGSLTIVTGDSSAGQVQSTDLVFANWTRTLFIYGRQRNQRWKIRGKIFFNRRLEGFPLIKTEVDNVMTPLNNLPRIFEATGESDYLEADVDFKYYFDRSLIGTCGTYKVFLYPPEFQRGRYTITFHYRKNNPDTLIMTEEFVTKCLKNGRRFLSLIRVGEYWRNHWIIRLLAENGEDNNDCPGKDLEIDVNKLPFEKLVEKLPGENQRIIVDFCRDTRGIIDVNSEMNKLDVRKMFRFNEDVQGEYGKPQAVKLQIPEESEPSDTVQTVINLKGGTKVNEDSLVFSEMLRTWATENERKILLIRGSNRKWKLKIIKRDGTATHIVKLRNIESIDYEPNDGSLRAPIVPDLATAEGTTIDVEEATIRALKKSHGYKARLINNPDCSKKT